MSIKQEFSQPKRRKEKRDLKIHVNSNEESLKELNGVLTKFFYIYFLSMGIPYY
jgi:hypothetical protein